MIVSRILGPKTTGPLAAATTILFLAGCVGDDSGESAGSVEGRVVVDNLSGPTQLTVDPDGMWWVAQLAGGENDGAGQIIRIDPDDLEAEPVLVVDGLDKPTGIALFAEQLWIMERNRLTRGPIDGSERMVVVDDLPTNGRSEGTLTVDGDRLLFDTSGALDRSTEPPSPVADSGILWAVDGDGSIAEVATGFKHAYAQTRTADGRLFTTEIGDGRYDGQRPDDELVEVEPGADHGWPRCIGDNRPVIEFGGSEGDCAGRPRSQAVFPPGATPTSVVVAPWDATMLLVALWNEGQVVAVPTGDTDDGSGGGERQGSVGQGLGDYTVVHRGAEHPQHLTVHDDQVLLTDHIAGAISVLERAG